MNAPLLPFAEENGREIWINPAHVVRLSVKDETKTWVWFAYGTGENDIVVQGEIRIVAAIMNREFKA